MKRIVTGILAHVDAGKTTLSESMLYLSGNIRKLGRVDHGDAFLDYNELEKSRGITIYLKQAIMNWNDCEFTLVDTPGHVDFSTEMERTLPILDYAILLINGMDGVQAHTQTIWKLLQHYHIPAFIFVNKMDAAYADVQTLMDNIKEKLSGNCVDFTHKNEEFYENIALCEESLLESYMETGDISTENIAKSISKRFIFPCFFGSALKMEGIEELLEGMRTYTMEKQYPQEFGAKIYKISHDAQGNQLTHMKITGGILKAKTKLKEDEKVDQVRLYSGNKYEMLQEIEAGRICAIKGLKSFLPGDGIGIEEHFQQPVLTSYMNYRIVPPVGYDQHLLLKQMNQLAKEDPQLHVTYTKQTDEIRVALMGEIQIDVLRKQISDRYGVEVAFDKGSVIYKETITEPIEGVGHFEPLRHYAEVHVLLEPLPRGSGLQFATDCPQDQLSGQFQRLILTHLEEIEHPGVLGGFPITDIKITLIGGKSHNKHTEGGDFRQATYRAVRQGLKKTTSILLEPYYEFQLDIPNEYISKAIFDIETMHGTFEIKDATDTNSIICGKAPVSMMQDYQQKVTAYTKGKGKLICSLKDYEPCENQEEILAQIGYDSETDLEHPTGSIFCSHGAGYYVPWNEVKKHMHVKYCWKPEEPKAIIQKQKNYQPGTDMDTELEKIFEQTYGTSKKRYTPAMEKKEIIAEPKISIIKKPQCILVDGYNVIHAWPELEELAMQNLDAARTKLINAMCNYQGYKNCLLILVFDAYKVQEGVGSMNQYHNIYVVYTRKAQTADMYIERATHKMANEYQVSVVTSDAMEQLIVIGQGAGRMSSRELKLELERIEKLEMSSYEHTQKKYRTYLLEDVKKYMDEESSEDT